MHEGSLLLKILKHKYAHHLAHEETPEGHIQTSSWSQSGRKILQRRVKEMLS